VLQKENGINIMREIASAIKNFGTK